MLFLGSETLVLPNGDGTKVPFPKIILKRDREDNGIISQ